MIIPPPSTPTVTVTVVSVFFDAQYHVDLPPLYETGAVYTVVYDAKSTRIYIDSEGGFVRLLTLNPGEFERVSLLLSDNRIETISGKVRVEGWGL